MNVRQRMVLVALVLLVLLAVPLGRTVLYTVSEREVAVVLQFGEPIVSRTEPGLYLKIPLIQDVARLPKTYQFWIATGADVVVDLPTADGKKIEVTPWAIWRITDPQRFLQVLRTVENAESRVKTFVRGEVRNTITRYNLSEIVRSSDRKLTYSFQVELPEPVGPARPGPDGLAPVPKPVAALNAAEKVTDGREKIVQKIKQAVQKELAKTEAGEQEGRGIELVDLGISRIDFVHVVREAAFDRLIAFMESIASRYVNEGQQRKQEILNRTEAEVQKILGEGRQEANRLRGQVEAEMIDGYAKAIQETGEFYNFTRTLEAYQQSLGRNTRLILTTNSDLFGLLKTNPAPPVPPKK